MSNRDFDNPTGSTTGGAGGSGSMGGAGGSTGGGAGSTGGGGSSTTGDSSQFGSPSTGLAGTGRTDAGTTRDSGGGSLATTGAGAGGGSTDAAGGGAAGGGGLAQQAKEYGQRITEAAGQARGYVTDKASVVGDKFRELQNKDFTQVADDAKQYARQNPGQALLISAAAGFLIGLLIRGGRR